MATAVSLHDNARSLLSWVRRRPSDRRLVESGMLGMLGCFAADADMRQLWQHTRDTFPEETHAVVWDAPLAANVSPADAHPSMRAIRHAGTVRDVAHSVDRNVVAVAAGLAAHSSKEWAPAEVLEVASLVVAAP